MNIEIKEEELKVQIQMAEGKGPAGKGGKRST